MARWLGDVRGLSEWGQMRTVCHACRGVSHEVAHDDDGATMMRPVVEPGDGSITRVIAAGDGVVAVPCDRCGESDTPGWIAGFVVPA